MAQAAALRCAAAAAGDLGVDWLNVAEEIESMGRSEQRGVHSALRRIIEHLLKLEHSPARDPRAGWHDSVIEHRIRVLDDLEASPSLWGRIDLDKAFRQARRLVADSLQRGGMTPDSLPEACPYSLEQVFDHDWWPTSRHGLSP
jgi:hypothetical protein